MEINTRVSLVLLFGLCFLCIAYSEARHGKKLPAALVVGTVHCQTCPQPIFSRTSHFISGAFVAVKCGHGGTLKASFYKEVKTDEHGVFQVYLPTHVSKHLKSIQGCSVQLVHSSESSCAVALSATSSSLHLKGRKDGTHVFLAGFFTFKPLKQPEFCSKKRNAPADKEFDPSKALSLSLGLSMFPPMPTIPPVPTIPTLLPTVPTLPFFPPLLPPLTPLPTLPVVPKTPTVQPENLELVKKPPISDQQSLSLTLPAIPAIPANPAVPAIPAFPTLPFFPPLLPGLLPTPGLPPVTGFPGIPPASSTKKTPSP